MTPASPALTRKRSRALLVDDAVDDLSPQKENSGASDLGSLKRRKLNTRAPSSGSAGRQGSIGQKLSGLSGSSGFHDGRGNETLGNADDVDELMGDGDIWQPDSTGNEETRGLNGSTSKSKGKHTPRANKPDNDIWEVEASDEEHTAGNNGIQRQNGRGKTDPKKSTLESAPIARGQDPVVKRPRGRPRKSDILRKAKAHSRQETRQRMISQNSEAANTQDLDVRKMRKRGRTNDESLPQSSPELAPSSIAVRRTRGDQGPGTPDPMNPVPKGILTPTKNVRRRFGKSVTFEHKEGELDLGFKDLPGSATTGSKPSSKSTEDAPRTVPEEDSSDESDEVVCQICSRLNSQKGNEILLCDGCDFSVHQKCYGVPVVPEGDWYCKECMPTSEADIEVDIIDEATAQNNIPEIVGLEVHLKNVQRVLLDRLTGRKRIKPCGHEEQIQKVHQVVEQTVLAGEGNSMLVIGGRGCGKTTVGAPRLYVNHTNVFGSLWTRLYLILQPTTERSSTL